jgi:hypothetical protein
MAKAANFPFGGIFLLPMLIQRICDLSQPCPSPIFILGPARRFFRPAIGRSWLVRKNEVGNF